MPDAEYVPPCVCHHPAHLHNGPWYSTALGTIARGCDECDCAYYVSEQFDGQAPPQPWSESRVEAYMENARIDRDDAP